MTLQDEVAEWAQKNFPDSEPWEPLVGLQEELGELSHAFLKQHQGIRQDEDLVSMEADAIGDIVLYLVHYCVLNNLSFQNCITHAWNTVKNRDWTKERKQSGKMG